MHTTAGAVARLNQQHSATTATAVVYMYANHSYRQYCGIVCSRRLDHMHIIHLCA
jgi:hypothetical protein